MAALLCLVAIAGWATNRFLIEPVRLDNQRSDVPTARVKVGSIQKVLRLTGSTRAKNFRSIAAPRMRGPDSGRSLVLTYVAPPGRMVKKGDLIAQIDAQALRDHVDDIQARVMDLNSNIKMRKAQQMIDLENLRQSQRVAKARWESAKLDLSTAEIRSAIDAELLKLTAEEAQATYKALTAEIPEVKASNALEIGILEIGKELQVRHRDRHLGDITDFTMRAPIDGLVVMQTIRRAGEWVQISEGDRVAPAQPFMRIVDTGSMRVEAVANQVESEELKVGQKARVHFDAFPSMKLDALVVNIGAIAEQPGRRGNEFQRTIPVFLSIQGSDRRIIPDLTTSSDIVVDQARNEPLVPIQAVESRDGKSFVRVKGEDGFETREVELGADDNVRIAVDKGIEQGEVVALN